MKVQQLTSDNFKSTIEKAGKPIIVDFYADWCGPCKMVSPIMEQIAEENQHIGVFKVNVDENPTLAAEFAVMSIPTIISFKDNNMYKKIIGARPKEDILDLVK